MKDSKNPWKKLSTKHIYENPWISVYEDQVITPANKEGIYGIVNFKNKALGIIPLDKDGFTYLVGQYRYPLDEYSWEIPMGGGKIGVDLLDSAKRELKEETGLTATKWTCITRIHTSNSVTDEEGFVFLAEDLQQGATEFEETEDITIKKVHFTEALQMVLDNKITDAISMIGILKLASILKINP